MAAVISILAGVMYIVSLAFCGYCAYKAYKSKNILDLVLFLFLILFISD